MSEITFEPELGTTLDKAILKAIAISIGLDQPINFVFNNKIIIVNPYEDISTIKTKLKLN